MACSFTVVSSSISTLYDCASVATIEKLALALEDAIWLKLGPIRPIGGYGRQRRKAEEVEGNGQVEKANDTGHCPQDLPT